MPIMAKCACGKRIGVADVMAGRTIRCPGCGGNVVVAAAGGGAAAAKGAATGRSPARGSAAATPAVSISPAQVTAAVVGVVVVGLALALYFGPWRVSSEWAAMSPKAATEVTDVVMFALQANQSEALAGVGDGPAGLGKTPGIEGSPTFIQPMMAFSMPRRITVMGKTSQGGYLGTYDTTSGEVVLNVEVGGATSGGLATLVKPTGTLHVTGREKAGVVTAESDGRPMQVIVPKYRGRHGELDG